MGIENDQILCRMIAKAVKDDLHEAGFVTSDEKLVWDRCQQLDWLGIT